MEVEFCITHAVCEGNAINDVSSPGRAKGHLDSLDSVSEPNFSVWPCLTSPSLQISKVLLGVD